MTLPVATSLVTVLEATGLDATDSYDPAPTWEPVARNVRAVFASPSGLERTGRAEAETVTATLTMDPVAGFTHLHRVQDDQGVVWLVEWVQHVQGLGLDHITAGVVRHDGQAP